jgi:hypothetical protein
MPAPPESFYRRQPHEREVEVTDAKSVKLFIAPESPPGKGGNPASNLQAQCSPLGGEHGRGEDVAGRRRRFGE